MASQLTLSEEAGNLAEVLKQLNFAVRKGWCFQKDVAILYFLILFKCIFWRSHWFKLMTVLNKQKQQAIDLNFSSVVNFLDRKFRKTQIHLPEVPSYMYKKNGSKLEITVYSNPKIAKIDVRMINLKNYDREASFECSYNLDGLSMTEFQRHIDDLISQMN